MGLLSLPRTNCADLGGGLDMARCPKRKAKAPPENAPLGGCPPTLAQETLAHTPWQVKTSWLGEEGPWVKQER
jgi:hypothetical protein